MPIGIQGEPSRRATLRRCGAVGEAVAELLRYSENVFDFDALTGGVELPLPDEPMVACWEGWAAAARQRGAFAVLAEHLPQLRFPVREGMSRSAAYQAATRRGVAPDELPAATGLGLARPEAVELALHASPAGRIPVLTVRGRPEFVALVQALGARNEPVAVPAAQGALMISGLANWTRLAALRQAWERGEGQPSRATTWGEELARLQAGHRELYQDRLILLSDGPYSGVPAADLGLGEAEWSELSLTLRREHECAHYLTRRLLGSMRNNLLDELIADYAGMVAAIGRFRADWFLRFLGVEGAAGGAGRIAIYRGVPPLSPAAFAVLPALVRAAAQNLERFDRGLRPAEEAGAAPHGERQRTLVLLALAALRLDDLAAEDGVEVLARALAAVERPGGERAST